MAFTSNTGSEFMKSIGFDGTDIYDLFGTIPSNIVTEQWDRLVDDFLTKTKTIQNYICSKFSTGLIGYFNIVHCYSFDKHYSINIKLDKSYSKNLNQLINKFDYELVPYVSWILDKDKKRIPERINYFTVNILI